MPYKIYTYEDPYKLDKADFWDEISNLPHFCSARTLVNGLKSALKGNIKGLICPLDEFVNHEEIYKEWTNNINLKLQQYSFFSTYFRNLLDNDLIDKQFFMALSQNQNHFLDAIRLFIELDIDSAYVDGEKGNREQRLFVQALKDAESNKLFQFPRIPNKEKVKSIVVSLAKKEVDECRGPISEIERCEKAVKITGDHPLDSIVIHGVHQFTPAQLRLIITLEKMGINIIFLYNYQKKYPKLYSSWNDIYSCFEVPIHHDTIVNEYKMPYIQNPSNALACAIGELCEERLNENRDKVQEWYKVFKNIELREFANITEYAHFVSNHVEAAQQKYIESRSVIDSGNGVWDNAAVLKNMDEQVYTANKDVHTLLKIYYPEYTKDRHFLSYPIGQFFSAIYKLWDYESGEILFDIGAIKECLNSNILQSAPAELLLRTFYNTEILYENIKTYSEFKNQIKEKFLSNYDKVTTSTEKEIIFPLRKLSVYSKYKTTKTELENLISAIDEINEIAKQLFSIDDSHQDFIDFGKHFKNLEEFLKQRELSLANEQEQALISEIQLRLDKIKPEESTFSGTFRDLREGLHFFLKQKKDENDNVDWLVKNFEQIDGDILQSKQQFEREEKKTYHFGCLSDRDMNSSVNDQLPWPLTDEFIHESYSPIDLQFQVYYTSLCERSGFLRYELFYGLFFNLNDVRLSYVKEYGEETTEPYVLLSILGLEPKTGVIDELEDTSAFTINIKKDSIGKIKYDRYQMMDMLLCPYRYYLDYIMEDAPVIQGDFLYQKYFENLLIEAVWKRIGSKQKSDALNYLPQILNQESKKLEDYFSFWKETEIFDIKLRAQHYLENEIINYDGRYDNGNTVREYAPSHMTMRRLFGKAKFVVDISEVENKNPYYSFEALSKRKYPIKEYSLHKLPKPNQNSKAQELSETLIKETTDYLNSCNNEEISIPSDWCAYCVHKGMCMKPYLSE